MSRLLYVVHALPDWDPSGTPLVTTSYMTQAIEAGHEVAVAIPALPDSRTVQMPGITVIPMARAGELPWALMAYTKAPDDIPGSAQVKKFHPDLVHVIDWVHFPSGLLKALRELQVPIIRHMWSLEDMCAFIDPICFLPDHRPCQTLSENQCGECIVRRLVNVRTSVDGPIDQVIEQFTKSRALNVEHFAKRMNTKWQTFQRHLESLYTVIVFPCNSFRKYAEGLFPFASVRCETIEHGLAEPAVAMQTPAERPPHFVFLGPCESRKGWPIIEAAFSRILDQRPGSLQLRAYGASPQSPLSSRQGVSLLPSFSYSRLSEILTGAHVGLLPSFFETFSRACREFLAHGLAVVGSEAYGIPMPSIMSKTA